MCGEMTCNCTDPDVRNKDKCCKAICKLEQGCELPGGGRLEREETADTKDGCQQCSCSVSCCRLQD